MEDFQQLPIGFEDPLPHAEEEHHLWGKICGLCAADERRCVVLRDKADWAHQSISQRLALARYEMITFPTAQNLNRMMALYSVAKRLRTLYLDAENNLLAARDRKIICLRRYGINNAGH